MELKGGFCMNNEEKKQPEVVSEAAEETAKKAVLETVVETEAAENAAAEAPAEEKAEKAAPAKEPSFLKKLFSGKKARKSADMQRRLRHGRTARVLTVVVVALVILLNVVFQILGNRFPFTLDLTGDYTLSDTSIELAKSITKPIDIVVFAPEETFSNTSSAAARSYTYGFEQAAQALSEFYSAVKQYKSYSDGKVNVTYIDMNSEPTAVNNYKSYTSETIESGDILFISGNRCKTASVTTDLFTADSSSYYSTGQYTFTSTVEQTLATKIKSVQDTTDRVLTLFTGHTEDDTVIKGLQQVYNLNGYDIEEVDLTKSTQISENTVCAVIPAPTVDYSKDEIERLRKWLANDGKEGRNLLVFTHPTASLPNLYEFLEVEYGMEVTDNLVVETDANRLYAYTSAYATYGDIASTDFTKNSAGEAKAMTWYTRQIIPHWEAKTDTSTQYSVNLVTFADTARLVSTDEASQSQAPKQTEYDGTIVGMAVAVKEGYQNTLEVDTVTRVAVCGSAYIPTPNFISVQTAENENLLLDTMSALTGVVNSINISSKPLETTTVSFSATARTLVGLILLTLVLPIGLIVTGIVIFMKRRHL